jgi:excisionase family DNA binding protein
MSGEVTDKLLLSAGEAAGLLSVSRSHFLGLHSAGKIPLPRRLGGSVRWSTRELAEWIDAGCPARDQWERVKSQV